MDHVFSDAIPQRVVTEIVDSDRFDRAFRERTLPISKTTRRPYVDS